MDFIRNKLVKHRKGTTEVILCSKHGKQGCVFASHNFVDSVNNKKKYTGKLYILGLNTLVGTSYHWADEGFLNENNVLKQSLDCEGKHTY